MEVLRIPADDETEEQRLEIRKKEKERINEILKKAKKKPKTEEEEAAEMHNLISRLSD